jgi:hypothetical protein
MLKRLVTLIEAKGLQCEGIYRNGGVSTKASFYWKTQIWNLKNYQYRSTQ